MIDELTGLEVPPEIAAATLEMEKKAHEAFKDKANQMREYTQQSATEPGPENLPPSLIPFDEFERRIRVLRENGVRIYQDNLIKVQIDTFKRQPDPVPLAHETVST